MIIMKCLLCFSIMSSNSVSCSRFKQNAWKKELCSNCYRPKEEHTVQERVKPSPLYIPLKAPAQGILNLGGKNRSSTTLSKSSTKKKSVRFTKDESEIIGIDGGDTDSDDEEDDADDDDSSNNSSGCDTDEYSGSSAEEEKALERLTKTNTDFNSILSNLSLDSSTTTSSASAAVSAVSLHQPQLLLGAKQHKQTLQVSIQPFGSQSSVTCKSIAASRKSHLNKLLEDEQPKSSAVTPLLLLSSSPDENHDPLLVKSKQLLEKDRKKAEEPDLISAVNSVFIESSRKEERGNPEGRKTHIQRGNVITKSHEQVKNKLYIQNIAQKEKRNSLLQDKTNESEDLKKLIIRTPGPDYEDQKNNITKNNEDMSSKQEIKDDIKAPVVLPPTSLKIDSEVTVKVLKLLNGEDGPAESREMAGEPDGKADSDEPETPVVVSPPPRASFLHRDAIQQHHVPAPSPPPLSSPVLCSPHLSPTASSSSPSSPLSLAALSPLSESKQSPLNSPAATSPSLPTSAAIQTPSPTDDHPSPTYEIPTSPVLLLARCKRPAPKPPTPDLLPPPAPPQQHSPPPLPPPPPPPEPIPRQRRGSSETLLTSVVMAASTPGGTVSEKKKTRVRQTLRKLLRFGSREDETAAATGGGAKEEDSQLISQQNQTQRPRPQIIHPLDLNKSGVQVLPAANSSNSTSEKSPETPSTPTSSIFSPARPGKPPPPPRSESLNLMERLRPSPNSENNVYANLGEGRCGITPVKPQRTGSLRDQTANSSCGNTSGVMKTNTSTTNQQTQQQSIGSIQSKLSAMITQHQQHADNDHVYECVGVSSVPECDMERQRTSLQYSSAGSETESDIYYPYVTFQNGECKTKLKKRERGKVHSTLEENYGAVVVANYEALSHLLTQLKERKPPMCADLERFVNNAEWSGLNCNNEHYSCTRIGSIAFISGKLGENCENVTLAVKGNQEVHLPSDLQPLVTFTDHIPAHILGLDFIQLQKYNISLLGRLKLERLYDYGVKLERTAEGVREGVLVLLQAVEVILSNSVRVRYDPNNFIVYVRHGESTPRATYIPTAAPPANKVSDELLTKDVCETLQILTKTLLSDVPLCKIIGNSKSAREMKSLLETWLWGPTVALAPQALRRWLDLERATFLHSHICNNSQLTDESADPARQLHLKFLVETDIQDIAAATNQFREAANNNNNNNNNLTDSTIVVDDVV
ncbi:hypothetical protein O3M35_005966 [Rhynocoris fuscipes]|uniref:Uncharacterized protein n=1 Tax=Rhynocoris fuscipes TaxID=488301 RepID=A0AAW1DE80_9HEMI